VASREDAGEKPVLGSIPLSAIQVAGGIPKGASRTRAAWSGRGTDDSAAGSADRCSSQGSARPACGRSADRGAGEAADDCAAGSAFARGVASGYGKHQRTRRDG
jgi:hypothetical protein